MKKTTTVICIFTFLAIGSCDANESTKKIPKDTTEIVKNFARYSDSEIIAYAEKAARDNQHLKEIIKDYEDKNIFKADRNYSNEVRLNREDGKVTFSHSGCSYDGTSIDISIFLYPESIKNLVPYKYEVTLVPCGLE